METKAHQEEAQSLESQQEEVSLGASRHSPLKEEEYLANLQLRSEAGESLEVSLSPQQEGVYLDLLRKQHPLDQTRHQEAYSNQPQEEESLEVVKLNKHQVLEVAPLEAPFLGDKLSLNLKEEEEYLEQSLQQDSTKDHLGEANKVPFLKVKLKTQQEVFLLVTLVKEELQTTISLKFKTETMETQEVNLS